MLDTFIDITQRIVKKEGFADYLPTLLFPDRNEILVLDGIPELDNHESIALDWVAEKVRSQENFLVAFKVDQTHFKVIGRLDGTDQERICPVDMP